MKTYVVFYGNDWIRVEASTASEAARKAAQAMELPKTAVLSVSRGTDPWSLLPPEVEGNVDDGAYRADGTPF